MFTGFNIKFLAIFLLTAVMAYTQEPDRKTLQDKIAENSKLFAADPDQAFLDITALLEESEKSKDYQSELILLDRRCWYYNYSSDIESLIRSALFLEKKAVEYKSRRFQASAHVYLLNAYAINRLYEKAIAEFDKAMAILEREDAEEPEIIKVKTNAYTYMSNLYNYREDEKTALSYLLSAAQEFKKLKDPERRKRSQYRNYAHIASCYIAIDLDSAEYYVNKSMSLKPENASPDYYIMFMNYTQLGQIQRLRKNYTEALIYYHQAEKIAQENSSSGNILNKKVLFYGFLQAYEALSDTANISLYRLKLKEAELTVEQSKNKSLHKILENSPENDTAKTNLALAAGGMILVFCVIFIIRLYRKNRSLYRQEEQSKQYLDELQNLPYTREESYKELLEMVQNNDPDFLEAFYKAYPGFLEKLKAINESIVPTEMEFCALLKLNIPTKEIARYKNIEPRSVQTKKYRIRKKLNIPGSEDIYFWFNKI